MPSRDGSALFRFEEYATIIPLIQNVYWPEDDGDLGWSVWLKYTTGVFEFFAFKTRAEADIVHAQLLEAIDDYWVK